ncbi:MULTISPECIES: hypothetical protein [Nocardia]|uniref:hypothetical protein n=1 Tax=Nocardia TaxID=1817 RepID=UPI0011B27053|nr:MULTISPECIES: hypothetical protein [Nocardia]
MSTQRRHRDTVQDQAIESTTARQNLTRFEDFISATLESDRAKHESHWLARGCLTEPTPAGVVRLVLQSKSLKSIADTADQPLAEIISKFEVALILLRDAVSRHPLPQDFKQPGVIGQLRRLLERESEGQVTTVYCERHGYTEDTGMARCPACPCVLPPPRISSEVEFFGSSSTGRPRQYCSNACRQRMYRRRRREQGESSRHV